MDKAHIAAAEGLHGELVALSAAGVNCEAAFFFWFLFCARFGARISRRMAVMVPDDIGLIPLHHAARYGHVECVKLLLQTGTPVSARSSQRMTALHYAAASGNAALADLS
jgi:hypothetical protein